MYIGENRDKKLIDLTNQFEEYFLNIDDQISLNNKWEEKDSVEIEIKKSFVRGLLRYSSHSLKLISCVKNIFKGSSFVGLFVEKMKVMMVNKLIHKNLIT